MIVEILTSAILPGMKQRSIGKMFFLFIVTFGFYRLYWLAKTRVELQEKTKLKIPSIWILLVPYILVVFAVGMIMASSFNSSSTIVDSESNSGLCYGGVNAPAYCDGDDEEGSELDAIGVIGMILMYVSLLVIFPLMGWWYWKYAQAVEKVTHEKLSFPVTMLIMLAVPDIFDMLIVQDSFNKLKRKASA